MAYLFTSESVSEGHPDKVADQISDAMLDEFLRKDPKSKVAVETLVTTGLVVLAGEVQTDAWVEPQSVVRETLKDIGYTKAEYQFEANSCGIISTIHEQSADIRQGVDRTSPEEQGAGDQGMMFGYACREQDNFMPLPIELAHDLLHQLAEIRKKSPELMPYLRPDSKSQVTMLYSDDGTPQKIETIVLSTQHDEFEKAAGNSPDARKQAEDKMQGKILADVRSILLPRLREYYSSRGNTSVLRLLENIDKIFVNPTGKFVIGGPHGDSGLTGRKIIVDTYGGRGAHGGGAFSGKDPSKVDRSAAYAARHLAKNLVAAHIADEVLVQVAYAIGIAKPVGIYVNTYGTAKVNGKDGSKLTDGQIAERLGDIYDFRPYAIIERLGLKNPIFRETARYGHFGRDPYTKKVEFCYDTHESVLRNQHCEEKFYRDVDFFAWEKLNLVEDLRKGFSL